MGFRIGAGPGSIAQLNVKASLWLGHIKAGGGSWPSRSGTVQFLVVPVTVIALGRHTQAGSVTNNTLYGGNGTVPLLARPGTGPTAAYAG
jgi:hypothetical protein